MNGHRVIFCFLSCLLGSAHVVWAQSIESIAVYRDAAVVHWVSGPSDAGQLAWSFSPFEGASGVMMADGDLPVRLAPPSTEDWFGGAGADAFEQARENARLLNTDLALKQAQLDLVEEDLALLRANRSVSGTSEALLVEDLEEAADWMHDAFRDALYRRVELREEVAALEADVQKWHRIQGESAPRRVHGLQLAGAPSAPVHTERVETNGMAWSPADQVEVDLTAGQALWHRRIRYTLDLPFAEELTPTFIEANWATREAGGQGMEEGTGGASYGRSSSPAKSKAYASNRSRLVEGDPRHRFPADQPVLPGEHEGVVSAGSVSLTAVSRHVCVPKWAAVVDHWIHVATSGAVLAESDQVQLCIEGQCEGQRAMSAHGDTVRIHAGVDDAWRVMRKREAALCNRSVLGNRIKHQQAHSITVENRSGATGEVTVIEPLPRSKALEVEVNADALDGGQWDAATREIRWRLSLKPGETRTLRFQVQLEHAPEVKLEDIQ